MANKTGETKNNWSLFYKTVSTLANSQGFYSRIWSELSEMSDSELSEIKDKINNLDTKFNDTVDVIMFLEG